MTQQVQYKVLWVEDDNTIIEGTKLNAESFNLNLINFSNWADAENELKNNFNEYSAIILDALCKKNSNSIPDPHFISFALTSMNKLFGEKHKVLPWYILSAGTMSNFDFVIEGAIDIRKDYQQEWGNLLYFKDRPDEDPVSSENLFKQIEIVAKEQTTNIVIHRHKDVFNCLGEDKIIKYTQARKYMIKMLCALYNPEEYLNYEYEANPLRKVLEYIFRAGVDHGIIPENCIEGGNKVSLQLCSLFLKGKDINFDKSQISKKWNAEPIFDSSTSMITKNILDFANSNSHTEEDEKYVIDCDKKDLFFSYLFQLCHVIIYFSNYIKLHPDKDSNLRNIIDVEFVKENKKSKEDNIQKKEKNKEPNLSNAEKYPEFDKQKEDYIGQKFLVKKVGNIYECGKLKLSEELSIPSNIKLITIKNVIENKGEDRETYKFIVTEI